MLDDSRKRCPVRNGQEACQHGGRCTWPDLRARAPSRFRTDAGHGVFCTTPIPCVTCDLGRRNDEAEHGLPSAGTGRNGNARTCRRRLRHRDFWRSAGPTGPGPGAENRDLEQESLSLHLMACNGTFGYSDPGRFHQTVLDMMSGFLHAGPPVIQPAVRRSGAGLAGRRQDGKSDRDD